jgi:hypothetical protein
MGAEEGRAFYWRRSGGSNACFSCPHEHLARIPPSGEVPAITILAGPCVG